MTDAGARAVLQGTLSRAARRLKAQRLLAELPALLAGGLAGPALALLLPPGPVARTLALLTPLVAAAALARRVLRTPPASEAAAWLDRRASLADTLTTACWFLDHPRQDPWVRHQRERAADAGSALDLQELVPLRLPPGPAVLAGALALVVVLAGRTPREPAPPPAAPVADAGLPPGNPGRSEPGSESDPGLGRDHVSDALPAPADLEALAEELRRGLGEDARQRLEELARRAAGARPRGAQPGEGDDESAPARSLSGEELAAALADAAQAVDAGDREAAARSLEEAAEAAEARQEPGADSPSPGEPGQAGAQDDAAAKAPADAGVRWSLDALDPLTMDAEEAPQAARGDAAGPPSGAGEPEEGEATELDVELERQALESESARETEPSEITEEASREQGSRVGYRGGAGGRYEAPSPQASAEVPWSDRERVRLYLLALTREETRR